MTDSSLSYRIVISHVGGMILKYLETYLQIWVCLFGIDYSIPSSD